MGRGGRLFLGHFLVLKWLKVLSEMNQELFTELKKLYSFSRTNNLNFRKYKGLYGKSEKIWTLNACISKSHSYPFLDIGKGWEAQIWTRVRPGGYLKTYRWDFWFFHFFGFFGQKCAKFQQFFCKYSSFLMAYPIRP